MHPSLCELQNADKIIVLRITPWVPLRMQKNFLHKTYQFIQTTSHLSCEPLIRCSHST